MFETIENAQKAVSQFRYPKIKSGLISRALPYSAHAQRGEPGGRDVLSTSIFIKGFDQVKWNHEDLYAKFCEFGKIVSCKVSIDTDHNFLGFGYIQYSKIEEA
jgi:RNA recognition motif-containing protein